MTDTRLRELAREMLETWRARVRGHGPGNIQVYAGPAISRCADELAALLDAEPETPSGWQPMMAELWARRHHLGQTDKAGAPYVYHLERVAHRATTDDVRAVAWLHDIIEDTAVSADDLRLAGFSDRIVDAVLVLTREDEPYDVYIGNVLASKCALAIEVKVLDLLDHLANPGCQESLRPRYVTALERLLPEAPR